MRPAASPRLIHDAAVEQGNAADHVDGAGELVLQPMREEIKRVARKAYLAKPLFPPAIAAGMIARNLLNGDLALAV